MFKRLLEILAVWLCSYKRIAYKSGRKPIGLKKIDQLRQLRKKGVKIADISKITGVSAVTVRKYVNARGILTKYGYIMQVKALRREKNA